MEQKKQEQEWQTNKCDDDVYVNILEKKKGKDEEQNKRRCIVRIIHGNINNSNVSSTNH